MPRLTEQDEEIWSAWERRCRAHERTALFRGRLARAWNIIQRFLEAEPAAYVAWSAGKDSTALVCLVTEVIVGRTIRLRTKAMSVKDDLDFPGEEAYLKQIAEQYNIDLDIVRPEQSLQTLLGRLDGEIDPSEDFHSRVSEFSRIAFYPLIEAYQKNHGRAVFLGLRGEESKGRKMNAWLRGPIYERKDGGRICQPLSCWSGLDVFAYLFSRDIPILNIYKCCRFHENPSFVRKSWWLPGSNTRHGGMVWLRTYWPELYNNLRQLLPDVSFYG